MTSRQIEQVERRRFTRFPTANSGSSLSLVGRAGISLELKHCDLLNISYGGMCFQAAREFRQGEEVHFLIDLQKPLVDLVLVRAKILWVTAPNARRHTIGARFLDSSKGWLATEEELVH